LFLFLSIYSFIIAEKRTPLKLFAETRFEVRFYDCDPLGIVWHGNYARFFEMGRDAFVKQSDLDFLEIYHKYGFSTPLIAMDFSFKRPLTYKDIGIVRATFRPTDSAKLIFDYSIVKEATGERICTGSTTQVFVDQKTQQLSLTIPEFFKEWKNRMNV
jgi:acyl-CoA thioester hydrolase